MTTTGCPCVRFHAIHPVLCAWRRRSGGPRTLLAAPTGGAQCPRCKPMRRTGAADRGSRSRSASHTRHMLLSSQGTRPPVSMPRTPPPPTPPTWNIVSLNALEIDEGERAEEWSGFLHSSSSLWFLREMAAQREESTAVGRAPSHRARRPGTEHRARPRWDGAAAVAAHLTSDGTRPVRPLQWW